MRMLIGAHPSAVQQFASLQSAPVYTPAEGQVIWFGSAGEAGVTTTH